MNGLAVAVGRASVLDIAGSVRDEGPEGRFYERLAFFTTGELAGPVGRI